jgi:hypothetical protein
MKTITEQELGAALQNLTKEHKTNWLKLISRVHEVLNVMSARMGCPWTASEDITEHVTAVDFEAAGFTPAEAEALIFVLTEDCMGQPVNSIEMVERWFCYCAAK